MVKRYKCRHPDFPRYEDDDFDGRHAKMSLELKEIVQTAFIILCLFFVLLSIIFLVLLGVWFF